MSFASDCDAVPELLGASKRGLRALSAHDAARVSKRPATRLSTSIDIDSAFRASQPAGTMIAPSDLPPDTISADPFPATGVASGPVGPQAMRATA